MRQAVMVGVVLPAALLLVSGCATKKWVTEFVGKKEVDIDQKVDKKVADESQRVDQKVEGVDTRLKTAEGTLTQTSETAKGAKDRADSAYTKADETNSRLTRLWSNRNNRNQVETYPVLFGFDKWDLNDNAQTTLVAVPMSARRSSAPATLARWSRPDRSSSIGPIRASTFISSAPTPATSRKKWWSRRSISDWWKDRSTTRI